MTLRRRITGWGAPARFLTAAAVFLMAVVPALAASARAQITPDDVAAADAHRREIGADLASTTAEYDAAVGRLRELEDSLASLGAELGELERDLAIARVAAKEIATDRYIYAGAGSGQSALFDSASIDDVSLRSSYLERLSREGSDTITRMFALEGNYQDQQARVATALESQQQINAELELVAADIMAQLEAANQEYNDLVAAYEKQEAERRAREEAERKAAEEAARKAAEEEARRQAAQTTTTTSGDTSATTTTQPATTTTQPPTTTPPPSGSMVCPVDGAVSFVDSWGAPRSGGRSHKGVDMIAAKGTPLVAIESGTIRKMGNGGLGGITVYLTGNSGDVYYYAHLNAWADGLSVGQSVSVGELIGYVGNSGNAQYTVSHLHFEYKPSGGSSINPYPLVAGLCF